jgi:hypothetical protein
MHWSDLQIVRHAVAQRKREAGDEKGAMRVDEGQEDDSPEIQLGLWFRLRRQPAGAEYESAWDEFDRFRQPVF